jgi:hypothetical protein
LIPVTAAAAVMRTARPSHASQLMTVMLQDAARPPIHRDAIVDTLRKLTRSQQRAGRSRSRPSATQRFHKVSPLASLTDVGEIRGTRCASTLARVSRIVLTNDENPQLT